MVADALTDGHILLADWLFLIGAIVAVLAGVLYYVSPGLHGAEPVRRPGTAAALLCVALALVALGLLVL